MRVSINWLKEYVETGDDISQISKLLSGIGLEVEEVSKTGSDTIIDIEVTPQRPDLLGMWGIARELSIFTNKKLKPPEYKVYTDTAENISVDIDDSSLCGRYSCGVIINIQGGETPEWIKERLVAMGTIPQDNIVDIGNYVMYETGQPIHIFDLDKISGHINVRKSRTGDYITTLDNIHREISKDVLLICDEKLPIAIAGIMGGKDSMVTSNTRNLLVESAYFNPLIIRKGGKKLGISTEASYRFERGGDIEITSIALYRVMTLLQELYGAESGGIVDEYRDRFESREIKISSEYATRVLGAPLSKEEINTCIGKLGFNIQNSKVKIPSYRGDISSEIDLIEEIARLIGYDNFQPQIPSSYLVDKKITLVNTIKNALVTLGLNEVYTMPLVTDGNIRIKNYMRDDMCSLRSNITQGLLLVVSNNNSYGMTDLRIFEIGRVFNPVDEKPERIVLSILITGERSRKPLWSDAELDFSDIKGILEGLFEILNIEEWDLTYTSTDNYETGCVINIGKEIVGFMGSFKHDILKKYNVNSPSYGIDIDIDKLIPSRLERYNPISRFPGVERDISVIVRNDISAASIIEFVKKRSPQILEDLSVFDYYNGEDIPSDKVALGLRLYFRVKDRTLKKSEVDSIVSSITNDLIGEYQASLRYS